jgi:hypothetical protein
MIMQLTAQQERLLEEGRSVEVDVDGRRCILLTRETYDRLTSAEIDASPWTDEEIDLLAMEAVHS